MQVKKLIKLLKEVERIKPDSTVYLTTEKSTYNFTGLGIDDVSDVELFVVVGDKEA